MHRCIKAAALLLTVFSTHAAEPDFDFEKLMEQVEFDANELQTSIVFEDVEAGVALATSLRDAFGQIEGFFADWGYADDAVEYSRQYQQKAEQIITLIQEKNFSDATDRTLEFSKDCKACHDRYKPL